MTNDHVCVYVSCTETHAEEDMHVRVSGGGGVPTDLFISNEVSKDGILFQEQRSPIFYLSRLLQESSKKE